MTVLHFETIDSTNNYGKQLIRSGNFEHGTLIVADLQTGGRGRFDRVFYSQGGLYMSLLLDARHLAYPLTCAAAVAVQQTVAETSDIQLSVKWVNDLLYQRKKVCGILTEAVCDAKGKLLGFVCGIGLNTQDTVLPECLQDIANTLPISKKGLAQAIGEKLLRFYNSFTDVIPMYKDILLLGMDVDVYQGDHFLFSGIAIDINSAGNLIVAVDEERRVLTSGEISIKMN